MKQREILKKEIVILVFLAILFFVLQVLLQTSSSVVVLNVYRGVFSALQYGVCLLMVFTNLKYGTRVALGLMSVSVATTLFALFHGANDALPGFFNAIFYIITIVIFSKYDTRREIENRTDYITEVYNRKGLYIMLQERIERNKEFSIIYISLNIFKVINDSYGHAYGDELLCKITRRIEEILGEECPVARVGGAEFVVAVDGKQSAQEIADKLLEGIREKSILIVEASIVECYVEGFAGVSSFPVDATDYESLIKYADIAMTEALAQKSKHACIFNVEMLENVNRQMYLMNLIKEALVKDYFYLTYQPQFEINQKKLRGFETLTRLKTEKGEVVSPAEFIPAAEKSDLILQIDDYVMERSMREFKEVILANPELILSVNVSAKNFGEKGFVEKVRMNLEKVDFPAQNLEIEITEYCMVNSMDITTENINALREIGVQIALDDFGTGYTALNYVASLPFDLLKIDKSLIDDIENDKMRRDFVRAVITMGQLMKCEVIAEGVENGNQIRCLQENGCDFVQGFVWGRPLVFHEAIQLLPQ